MACVPLQNCVPISDLSPNTARPNVLGIIIAKTDSKGFPDRRNVGSERFTFGFTIKDSADHSINVSSWGKEDYIQRLCSQIRIGDCVVIENPLVVNKDPEREDRFCPSTSSFYRLLVTETHSGIRMCSDLETEARLLSLFHIPLKDSSDFYSLGDITVNGQSLSGTFINILAAVRSVGEQKFFTTSAGRNGQRLEIKLFDETLASFPLVCWDRETIQLMQELIPRETVLFIADARISFDGFRNSMLATATSKTIITINPDTTEANHLFNYAREISDSGCLDDQESDNVPLESINDVLTVKQIKAKVQENSDVFLAVIYAFFTTLGLDSSMSRLICSRCTTCRFRVSEETGACSNTACPNQGQSLKAFVEISLLVDITDHTGTLKGCFLTGTAAEKTLGCTSEEFMCLPELHRMDMKWRFLLERSKIYLKVFPSEKNGIRAQILSCTLADPWDVKQSLSALIV